MNLVWFGLGGMVMCGSLAVLYQNSKSILDIRSHAAQLERILDDTLRDWRQAAEPMFRRNNSVSPDPAGFADIEKRLSQLNRAGSLPERLRIVRGLSRRYHEIYAARLHQSTDADEQWSLFQMDFEALSHLEKALGDTVELYNDTVRAYNKRWAGGHRWLLGRVLRWLPMEPLTPL
ncbi:MAG TPA: hypothetical protein PK876_00850 [Elusimicrobiota bacterium]|nr:hypothetical protein [Elusimicrobiota bacterium]